MHSTDDGGQSASPAAGREDRTTAPAAGPPTRAPGPEPDAGARSGDDGGMGGDLAAVRAHQQAAIAALGVRALGGIAVPVLLHDAAEVVRRTLDTEFVKILELLPDGETARLVAGVGWREGVVGSATITVGRDSQAGYALLSHQPVVVEDLASDPRLGEPPLLRDHGVVSGMSVILYGPGGRSYGVLGAHTAQRRRFSEDDVHFLQGIANVLSAALHRQYVEDELRRAHAEAEAFAAQLQEQATELEVQTEEAQSLAEELEQANEALLHTTHDAERARDASAFLAEASRLLGESLEYEATLSAVARAAVPRLADWCAVDMLTEQRPVGATEPWPPRVERLAVVHQDPAKVEWAREIERRQPQDWSASTGLPRVLREGVTEFYPVITDEQLVAGARTPEELALLREIGFQAFLCVPLVARGMMLGALTLVMTESRRHYDEDDRALAEDLARRAALAVDNARLYRDAERARADAERARREAEAANAAKSEFLATMSHELRTPLNAISGYAELLALGLRGPVTDAQRDDLSRIQRSQRHLLGLINDVLNFARLESGRVEYDVQPVLVADVVRDVRPMVDPLVHAKGLRLDVRLPEDTGEPPIHVWADREKLGQVLLNLLSNAIKFTPAGRNGVSGTVTVELSARPEDGGSTSPDRAYLRVRDTGVGIPVAKLESIFEPFVQVRSELTRESGGTGLGLAISRDLARGMGGDLQVQSTLGAGSTFTLELRRVHSVAGEPVDRRARDDRRLEEDRRSGEDRREPGGEPPDAVSAARGEP